MPDSAVPQSRATVRIETREPYELINEADDSPVLGAGFTQAFRDFHAENPQVYELFKEFAFEALAVGRNKLSAKLIVERIRWETSVKTSDTQFTVNNNHTADYARLFLKDFPEYKGFFRTMKRKVV